jgi:hypothetical protein
MQKPLHEDIEIAFKDVAKAVRLYCWDCSNPPSDKMYEALRAVDKMEALLASDYKSLWLIVEEDARRWEKKCAETRAELRNLISSQIEKEGNVVLNPEDDGSSYCSSFSKVAPSAIPHIDEDGVETCVNTDETNPPLSRVRSMSYESEGDS